MFYIIFSGLTPPSARERYAVSHYDYYYYYYQYYYYYHVIIIIIVIIIIRYVQGCLYICLIINMLQGLFRDRICLICYIDMFIHMYMFRVYLGTYYDKPVGWFPIHYNVQGPPVQGPPHYKLIYPYLAGQTRQPRPGMGRGRGMGM